MEDASEESRKVVAKGDRFQVVVMDSIAHAVDADAGQIVVTGSHGGRSAGEYALSFGVACVVCCDAGFGKNGSGVAGLRDLDRTRIAGIGVAHTSARIGDGVDIWERGVVSFVNAAAGRLGFVVGVPLKGQVLRLLAGGETERDPFEDRSTAVS